MNVDGVYGKCQRLVSVNWWMLFAKVDAIQQIRDMNP